MIFSHQEQALLVAALRVAAEQYENDAKNIIVAADGDPAPGYQRVVDQFKRQAVDARALADKFEEDISGEYTRWRAA